MNREDELEDNGYGFTGFYTYDKEEAKMEVKKERKKGNYATILKVVPSKYSRGGGLTGYSIYSKPKFANGVKE